MWVVLAWTATRSALTEQEQSEQGEAENQETGIGCIYHDIYRRKTNNMKPQAAAAVVACESATERGGSMASQKNETAGAPVKLEQR